MDTLGGFRFFSYIALYKNLSSIHSVLFRKKCVAIFSSMLGWAASVAFVLLSFSRFIYFLLFSPLFLVSYAMTLFIFLLLSPSFSLLFFLHLALPFRCLSLFPSINLQCLLPSSTPSYSSLPSELLPFLLFLYCLLLHFRLIPCSLSLFNDPLYSVPCGSSSPVRRTNAASGLR